jgi:RNA polymerase sigma-70 factor (ECF subfamily)
MASSVIDSPACALGVDGAPATDLPATASQTFDRLATLARDFEASYAVIHRYLLHRVFDPELADELAAETFCRAAASRHELPADAKDLRAWLLRVATNVANTRYRRERLRRLLLRPLEKVDAPAACRVTESAATEDERAVRARRALRSLTPKYQTVVVLRYYIEMSFDDIAAVLGCRPETVRTRLSRALKRLRERLGCQT